MRGHSIVVDINGFPVTHEKFYNSLKARGEIYDEVMVAYVEVFNERVDKNATDMNYRMKISFIPYFVRKLNLNPKNFDVKSLSRELRELRNMNKKFNLAKSDLLHFPIVHDHHWTLLCENLLFKKINLFDSLQSVDTGKKSVMSANMVTNFHRSCIETKCMNFDVTKFINVFSNDLPSKLISKNDNVPVSPVDYTPIWLPSIDHYDSGEYPAINS